MKNHHSISIIFCLVMVSCNSNDNDGVDCQLFDPAFETFSIELLDSDSNNLIENGTYDREEVQILYNGRSIGFINNTISFETVGDGETIFTVFLNDATKDTLELDVDSTLGPCDITFYSVISAKYNNESMVIRAENDYSKIITVTK